MTKRDSPVAPRPAIEIMKERATENYALLMASANGRQLEIEYPHWRLANGASAPLSLYERGLALRWQFFGGGVDAIGLAETGASPAATEALAQAYLRVDQEIGPVKIAASEERIVVVFRDAATRSLTQTERAAVDRFLDASAAYSAHRRSRSS